MKIKINKLKNQGVLLLEALLLLLIMLLVAGFTFYLGKRIVDWIKELQEKRERREQKLLPTNDFTGIHKNVINVEYLTNQFYLTSIK